MGVGDETRASNPNVRAAPIFWPLGLPLGLIPFLSFVNIDRFLMF